MSNSICVFSVDCRSTESKWELSNKWVKNLTFTLTQLTFNCSMTSFWCFCCYLWIYFTLFSSVNIVNFKQVNESCLNGTICNVVLKRSSHILILFSCSRGSRVGPWNFEHGRIMLETWNLLRKLRNKSNFEHMHILSWTDDCFIIISAWFKNNFKGLSKDV